MATLRETFDALTQAGILNLDVPEYIKDNLNKKFELREYQKKAINRLLYYNEKYPQKIKPSQLLFHMATGSGKTLLMAANILYLYKQGYRNYLFFVNSTNIIEKTRNNFLNKQSSKYLFNENIAIAGKEVPVKEVQNFEAVDNDGINIFFTTIQGLHSLMNSSRENSLTFEDFRDKKIIILSDEAHHINAWTKSGLSKEESISKNTWEHTVTSLFNSNKDNLMLEYTATIDLSEPSINEKYANKILYEYTLKEFRLDGYSKEIKVLQAELNAIDRALQAVIISQYRRKMAENNKLNIKPVILMKSKTIEESKEIMETFVAKIKNLKAEDLNKIKGKCTEENVLKKAFKYFEKEKITMTNLVVEIKEDFADNKCLLLDSNNIDEEKQLLVNSLEDKNNQLRVIFAVNMLNEGWDVLNLFDIVRLYNTRDSKTNRPGKTTIAEAQLIGRGARYCPFKLTEEQEKFKRKFDNDVENDLRVVEELYYHSATNSKYIQELTIALRETGIIPASEPKRIEIRIKDNFKRSTFWKNGLIFLNEKKKKDMTRIKGLNDIEINKLYKYNLLTGHTKASALFDENEKMKVEDRIYAEIKLKDFGICILRKAINRIEFYKFDNLRDYFPAMKSINEFLSTVSEIKVEIVSSKENLDNLTAKNKLDISTQVFDNIKLEIEKNHFEFIGTKLFKPVRIKEKLKDPAIINVAINENIYSDQEKGIAMKESRNIDLKIDLTKEDWYIYGENYGTSEEKYLIRFIQNNIAKLRANYSEVYLLRNESIFQIYRFLDGRAIEPDFVLFLKDKGAKKTISYQLFIEPKGNGLLIQDKWKEDFLREIEAEFKLEILSDEEDFKIIGMPFYNEDKRFEFLDEFNSKLKLQS